VNSCRIPDDCVPSPQFSQPLSASSLRALRQGSMFECHLRLAGQAVVGSIPSLANSALLAAHCAVGRSHASHTAAVQRDCRDPLQNSLPWSERGLGRSAALSSLSIATAIDCKRRLAPHPDPRPSRLARVLQSILNSRQHDPANRRFAVETWRPRLGVPDLVSPTWRPRLGVPD
jgi:hypothetical protein